MPRVPDEEVQLAREEIGDAWGQDFSELEREERIRRFEELKAQQQQKKNNVPPPMSRERSDGTRWSKDDIPNSEKHVEGGEWEAGYYPPEQQRRPAEAVQYLDASPLINSIVQLRNILQAGVQYVQDWFTYVTQMIYDLLGTEIGWMAKKADNTMLKSRVIQLIMMVKSILQAISKNGLECGIHSNFSEAQMKYILEEELNRSSQASGSSKFRVNDDGTIEVLPPGRIVKPDIKDLTGHRSYVTQMIYDLLGTEIGWMAKKADNTMLKSRVIQLIMMVKSILQAISKNGLECGIHSNFSEAQMKYILEEELNRSSQASGSSKFRVNDDGTIEVLPPGRIVKPDIKDLTEPDKSIEADEASSEDSTSGPTPDQQVQTPTADEQKSVESGIIIRDCFKSVSYEEMAQVRKWIADFEKRGGG